MTRTIGEAIEGRLHEMRIQQKELAAVIDVPVSTLNSWLRLGRDIPAHYILKIAHVLRCTPTYLLSGGEEDHEPLTRSDAIEDLIRATVAEVLRQQEAQKRRGDTEPQMRTAAYIERQREQLEQIRAEQSGAGRRTRRPDPRDVLPHGRGAAGRRDHGHTGSDPCVHASTYTSSDLSSPRRSATRSSTQPASRYLFAA